MILLYQFYSSLAISFTSLIVMDIDNKSPLTAPILGIVGGVFEIVDPLGNITKPMHPKLI